MLDNWHLYDGRQRMFLVICKYHNSSLPRSLRASLPLPSVLEDVLGPYGHVLLAGHRESGFYYRSM
jgi:hypothetical protein